MASKQPLVTVVAELFTGSQQQKLRPLTKQGIDTRQTGYGVDNRAFFYIYNIRVKLIVALFIY